MAPVNARFQRVSIMQVVMLANAALFGTLAVLHLGIPIGSWSEPRIAAASLVQNICALALMAGALAPFYARRASVMAAAIGNLIALTGVALGVIALAVGAGPRTLSNDVAHAVMAVLALTALWLLFARRARPKTE
jgi:hypothetical protein